MLRCFSFKVWMNVRPGNGFTDEDLFITLPVAFFMG